MRVQVDFVEWGGGARPAGEFPSLGLARGCLGLPYLERDRNPDLLAGFGLGRAYSQPTLDGVWLAYPKGPEQPPKTAVTAREPTNWPRTARSGEMRVLAEGTLVECHICGEPVASAGHHARWRHGLSPEGYRERFGLNRQTPLCAPSYSAKCRHRNYRLGLARHVRPYEFVKRPDSSPMPRRLEARRHISEVTRGVSRRPRRAAVDVCFTTDWGSLFRGR
jgi:hypothetical protein